MCFYNNSEFINCQDEWFNNILIPLIKNDELKELICQRGWFDFKKHILHGQIEICTDILKIYVENKNYRESLPFVRECIDFIEYITANNTDKYKKGDICFDCINEPAFLKLQFTDDIKTQLTSLKESCKQFFPIKVRIDTEIRQSLD